MTRKMRSMIDHVHTLFRFLPIGAAELQEGDGKQDVDAKMSMHEFASSKVVPLKDAMAKTCWTDAQEERIKMLGRAISSFLELLKEVAEGGLEVGVKCGETRNCFPMIVS